MLINAVPDDNLYRNLIMKSEKIDLNNPVVIFLTRLNLLAINNYQQKPELPYIKSMAFICYHITFYDTSMTLYY